MSRESYWSSLGIPAFIFVGAVGVTLLLTLIVVHDDEGPRLSGVQQSENGAVGWTYLKRTSQGTRPLHESHLNPTLSVAMSIALLAVSLLVYEMSRKRRLREDGPPSIDPPPPLRGELLMPVKLIGHLQLVAVKVETDVTD